MQNFYVDGVACTCIKPGNYICLLDTSIRRLHLKLVVRKFKIFMFKGIIYKVIVHCLGIVKAAKIKKPDLTAVNELDLGKAMDQLKSNDPKLTNLNLNNHQEVTTEVLEDVAKALKSNTNLKHLHLANTQMTDATAKVLF